MTAESPFVVGEIAALKAKFVAAEMVPVCTGVDIPGFSSYHRTTDGALGLEPATVCWVQIPSAPIDGSSTALACVKRVSLESIRSLVLGCGTFGGTPNDVTVTGPLSVSEGVLVPLIVYISRCAESRIPTTYPSADEPKMFAGTGVKLVPGSNLVTVGLGHDETVVAFGGLGIAK